MKRKIVFFIKIVMIIAICLNLCSCGVQKEVYDVWNDAIYTEDTEFGTGEKTVEVEVVVMDNSLTFTFYTDKETLGEVLSEHKLIEGKKGPYGLYVKKVNGITADYDIDSTYWALTKNGESLMTGVDSTPVYDGEHYEITYTK